MPAAAASAAPPEGRAERRMEARGRGGDGRRPTAAHDPARASRRPRAPRLPRLASCALRHACSHEGHAAGARAGARSGAALGARSELRRRAHRARTAPATISRVASCSGSRSDFCATAAGSHTQPGRPARRSARGVARELRGSQGLAQRRGAARRRRARDPVQKSTFRHRAKVDFSRRRKSDFPRRESRTFRMRKVGLFASGKVDFSRQA